MTSSTHTTEPAQRLEQARPPWGRWGRLEVLLFAALAYLPQLLVQRGVATPDTKTYLYLNPGKFLKQIVSMWDPTVAAGTVTHQYVGYLFPEGPFYLVLHAIGTPLWVAQRLWLGSILFAAALGVRYMGRVLGLEAPGRTVAALAYMFSPFVLQYIGRMSVLLLPFAALPWLIGLIAKAVRSDGWRYPALFAIVIALVSSINASTIFYACLGPLLWILYAATTRETSWRRAIIASLKAALLSAGVCLWWVIGLLIESAYGVNVLKYTETVITTSSASTPAEVIRGLGYWYFYGFDELGAWTRSALVFTQNSFVVGASYVVPIGAGVAAAVARWRHRAFFILLVVIGLIAAVGPHPITAPTKFGGYLLRFMTKTSIGLAFRSTDRAVPLVTLGLAVLLGMGIAAIRSRWALIGGIVAAAAGLTVVLGNPAMFNGDTIANHFTQPATLPAAQLRAISSLNHSGGSSRVFGLPGNDFASYIWGNTVDTPQPAFLTRPYITPEQQVMGSIATAQTLYAIDDPIQQRYANPAAIAPMARLLGAGSLLLQYDLAYKHYSTIPPAELFTLFNPIPAGLGDPKSFGSRGLTSKTQTGQLKEVPEVATYSVANPRPITRAESDAGAVLFSGDAIGLNSAAGVGLLDTKSAIYYSGSLANDPARLHQLASKGAQLVVSDSNRKQGFRWTVISSSAGQIETPSDNPTVVDPSDSPVELFPTGSLSYKSFATDLGVASITASSYGPHSDYSPEYRPFNALDGNLDTSWRTSMGYPAQGQWWQVGFDQPTTIDHLTLVQPQSGRVSQWITSATLVFDGVTRYQIKLDEASRSPGGQLISLPKTTFRSLQIVIDSTTPGMAGVGFAEVGIPGHLATEVIQMPTDLLGALGTSSDANRLTLSMARWRTGPGSGHLDPEPSIVRSFSLPTARNFSLAGNATIASLLSPTEIASLTGGSTTGALPGTCTTSLLSIDGVPIPLAIQGSVTDALAGRIVAVSPCDWASEGIHLGAGRHLLTTAIGHATDTGWSIDQVLLDSQAGGAAASPSSPGRLVAIQAGAAPLLGVSSSSATSQRGSIRGATGPFELVLGQSVNAGWKATIAANGRSVDLGGSQLVDAFSNGWHISQSELQSLGQSVGHPTSLTYSLTWTPQRRMDWGFVISGLAFLACLWLAFRRRRHEDQPGDLRAAIRLAWPWSHRGPRMSWWLGGLTAGFLGAAAWFVAGAKIGVLVLGCSALAVWRPRARGLMTVGAALAMATAGLHVTLAEARHHFRFFGWPDNFNTDSRLVLLAVMLLGAEALIGIMVGLLRHEGAEEGAEMPVRSA